MTVSELWSFLLWCSVVNFAILTWWFLVFAFARDWLHRTHGRWFRLSNEQFDAIHYAGIAFFKICIFLFNLVPLIALSIVG
mgnify:CR=1 FL=1